MERTAPVDVELTAYMSMRARTLDLVDGLSQEDFDWSPGERKWSIGEVLDHLLLAEQFLQRDIGWLHERSRAGRPAHILHTFQDLDVGFPAVPRSVMPLLDWPLTVASLFVPLAVLDFFTRNRLFPLRHPAVAEPRRGRAAEELHQELRESCMRTAELVGQLSPHNAAAMTVSHPLLGTRNIPELIRFAAQHERRHQGQIADLKEMLTTRGRDGRLV